MKKNVKLFGSMATIFGTLFVMLILLIGIAAPVANADRMDENESIAKTRATTDQYLTCAFQSQIENLNTLTIQDVWSSYAVRVAYSGLSSYHEETQNIIPWMAYDWSPIGPSGSGEYDPSLNYDDNGTYDPSRVYEDPDPTTVANEALPSADLQVVVRMRPDILFHRARDWFDSGEDWESPHSSHTMPGEKMEVATAHDVVFSAEMLQWEAPLYQSGFLPLLQGTLGSKTDIEDENWVVNGGTGMYEGLQLYENGDSTYDYSMKFTLKEAYSMFYVATFPTVLPMKVWADHTLLTKGDDNALRWDCGQSGSIKDQKEALSGNGMFMWNDWDEGSFIQLDTNPDYFVDGTLDEDRPEGLSLKGVDFRPSFAGIEFLIRATTDAAVISLKNGEVDSFAWAIDPGYISDIQNSPDTDVMSTPDFGFFYMAFNHEVPAFGYKNYPGSGEQLGTWYGEDTGQLFREAIAHACEKSYIVNNLLQGYGSVGWSVVSPENGMYHNETVETYAFDLDKSEELLVEQNDLWQQEFSGFPNWDGPSDGVYPIPRRDSSGEIYADKDQFELLTPTATYDPIRAKAGIRIADTLRSELNVNIKATGQNFQSLVGRLDPGVRDYDMYVLGWSIGGFESLGSLEAFFHSRNDKAGGYNMPGFRNERFDKTVEEAEKEMNPEKKIKLVKEIQGIISQKLPYNVLYYRNQINGYRKDWQGWVSWPGGIWNGFSFANLEYGPGSGGVQITAPNEVNKNSEHDITIYLTDKNGDAIQGEELELEVSDNDATFEAKTSAVTDVNGVVNATFVAPDVEIPTVVTITVIRPEKDDQKTSKDIQVSSEPLTELYLDIDVDLNLIKYDSAATTTVEVTSGEADMDFINVTVTVAPTSGGAQVTPQEFMLSSGDSETVEFRAAQVAEGEIEEYTLTFTANRDGHQTAIETEEIQVEGPARVDDDDDDDGGDGFPLWAIGLIVIILVAIIGYVMYSKKQKGSEIEDEEEEQKD
ncbi:MAG: ABC transporter substrate-binding protein [Thermoplasmata archaeon]